MEENYKVGDIVIVTAGPREGKVATVERITAGKTEDEDSVPIVYLTVNGKPTQWEFGNELEPLFQ